MYPCPTGIRLLTLVYLSLFWSSFCSDESLHGAVICSHCNSKSIYWQADELVTLRETMQVMPGDHAAH